MRPIKRYDPDKETMCEYIDRLEAIINKMRVERLKLDKRIHNQRIALRQNWEIIEMREPYKRAWYRSPLLQSMLQNRMPLRRPKEKSPLRRLLGF